MTMRTKIITTIIGAVIIPSVALAGLVCLISLGYFEEYVGIHLRDQAYEAARVVDGQMYYGIKDLNTISTDPSYYLRDAKEVSKHLSKIAKTSAFYEVLSYTDAKGLVLSSSDPSYINKQLGFASDINLPSGDTQHHNHKSITEVFSQNSIHDIIANWNIRIYSEIKDVAGNEKGKLVGHVDMQHLNQIVNEAYRKLLEDNHPPTLEVIKEVVLFSPTDISILTPDPGLHSAYANRPSSDSLEYMVFEDSHGQKVIAGQAAMGEFGEQQFGVWTIILTAAYKQLMQPIFSILYKVGFSLAIILAIALAIGVYIAKNLTRPIEELSSVAERISAGEGKLRANTKRDDEIGLLAKSFNKMTDTIQNAKERAEMLLVQKSEFLACLSHEIRTPLNGIRWMSSMLADSNLNKEQKSQLEVTIDSIDSLQSMINAIIDFTKIETGQIQLSKRNFKLSRILKQVSVIVEKLAKEHNIEFSYEIDDDMPDALVGDAEHLSQVMIGLATCLMKVEQSGSAVMIVVNHDSSDKDSVHCSFSIINTLSASDPANMESFVKIFEQKDALNSVQTSNFGLETSVVAGLLQMMNSNLYVEKIAGYETGFHFSLCFKRPHAADVEKGEHRAEVENHEVSCEAQALNILVVEDNPVNQKVAYALLSRMGHEVEVACDGQEALKRLAIGHEYDVILLDCQMPVLDGYQTAKHIREREEQRNEHIPIVALTAYAMDGDKEKCIAAGMDAYLTKPLDQEQLQITLMSVTKTKRPA